MVRHSEDWWGVLRQGIESEHMGLVRQSSVLLGGLRLGAVRLGAEIELENMARAEQGWAGTGRVFIGRPRQGYGDRIRKYGKARRGAQWTGNGSDWCGVVSFGQDSPGMEIESENMGRLGSAPARRGTGAVWSGSTWWGFVW